MNNKYYLLLHKDLFKEENMICISLDDQEFWVLRESNEPDFYYTRNFIHSFYEMGINRYQITPDAFYKIKSLSKRQKSFINKYGNPIDLFSMWGVLDEVGEHFI